MTILVAEDDRSFRKGLVFELRDHGHAVQEVENGLEAIALIRTMHFDMVISDLIMPEADGLEVYQCIMETNPSIKFILLSGFGTSKRAQIAQGLLRENFLDKSINPESLIEKIEEMME